MKNWDNITINLKGDEYSWNFEQGTIHWYSNRTFSTPSAPVIYALNRHLLDQHGKQALDIWGRENLPLYLAWIQVLGATDNDFKKLSLSWMIEEDTQPSFRSPLHILGYHVGKSGPTDIVRREILRRAVTGDLPPSGDAMYRARWGMPNAPQRLARIISHLNNLIGPAGGSEGEFSQAYADWRSDIAWLKLEFDVIYNKIPKLTPEFITRSADTALDADFEHYPQVTDSVPTNPTPEPSEDSADDLSDKDLSDERERRLASLVQRFGQKEFRRNLLEAYGSRCPVTGCDVEGALQAAHIVPYLGPRTDRTSNGLPLQADIHNLFDLHLLSIAPQTMTVRIAPRLLRTCYAELDGKPLALPADGRSRPSEAALSRHYQQFLTAHGS